MQNKGIVITTAILLTLVSLFYLSFPIATSYYDSQAAKLKDPIAQQDYKDSVKYLGIYSYQKCLDTDWPWTGPEGRYECHSGNFSTRRGGESC